MERNFETNFGEIDIIAKDKDEYVFVEVKYRTDTASGFPEEAVTFRKMKTISKVSDVYRAKKYISDFEPMRFDVIAISGEEIRWYKNAFEYTY